MPRPPPPARGCSRLDRLRRSARACAPPPPCADAPRSPRPRRRCRRRGGARTSCPLASRVMVERQIGCARKIGTARTRASTQSNLLGVSLSERRYDPSRIEPKWQELWAREHTWEVANVPAGAHPPRGGCASASRKSYVLEMLPYPSGEPHIGHLKD